MANMTRQNDFFLSNGPNPRAVTQFAKIRLAAQYIRKTPQHKQSWKKIQLMEQPKLSRTINIDMETRWNSLAQFFKMLWTVEQLCASLSNGRGW